MSELTRDILLKAAEDVQSGMWCKTNWFRAVTPDEDGYQQTYIPEELFGGRLAVDEAMASLRCAEGSITIAAYLLGGKVSDVDDAVAAVQSHLTPVEGCVSVTQSCGQLWEFNDVHLPDAEFEAGQQLAELFRTTAESLT